MNFEPTSSGNPGPRVAILQSNYIPWKGYFDMIADVDHFVLYDEVQYTKNDWRNRNQYLSAGIAKWLTIAIPKQGQLRRRIDETVVADRSWARSHFDTLSQAYAKADHFVELRDELEALYARAGQFDRLSDINRLFIDFVCDYLSIDTNLSWSTEYNAKGDRIERLVDICTQLGAATYVTGPAARNYLDTTPFATAGIEVEWFNYSGYPEYPQHGDGEFVHGVTILDLLFNTGSESPRYMKLGSGVAVAREGTPS